MQPTPLTYFVFIRIALVVYSVTSIFTIAMIRVHVRFVCMKILVHISECEPLNDTTTSLQAMRQHAAYTM